MVRLLASFLLLLLAGAMSAVDTVTVVATDPTASESGDTATFTITRSASRTTALTVSFTVGGTATKNADYVALPASAVIPANATSTTVIVTPFDDTLAE